MQEFLGQRRHPNRRQTESSATMGTLFSGKVYGGLKTWAVLIIAVFLSNSVNGTGVRLKQVPVTEEGTGVSLGTVDQISGEDTRIHQFQDNAYIGFDDEYYYLMNLGLKEWGTIQTSLLMKKHPSDANFNLKTPFCSISDETTAYLLKSEFDLGNNSVIYDYEVNGDVMYVMNFAADIVAVKIVPQIDPSGKQDPSSKLEAKFKIAGLEAYSTEHLGQAFLEARMAIHSKQQILYIPTNVGLIGLDVENLEYHFLGKGVFKPMDNMVYADIVGDYLFVGYFYHGVEVYSVKNSSNIEYVGLIGKKILGMKSTDVLSMVDFIVHSYLMEIVVNDQKSLAKKPYANTFFKHEITTGELYEKKMLNLPQDSLMFIAEASGIHVLNLESILVNGTLPNKPFKFKIPITDPLLMVRFHETLYVLTYDADRDTSTVTEIFLFDTSLESWSSDATNSSQLYAINRNVTAPMYLDNIYVDDQYFYLIGNGTHYLYERGIPRAFQLDQARISRQIHDSFIADMHKFVIDGLPYLISVGPKRISEYKIIVADPSIRCPSVFNLSDSYGEYTMEINATTRTCPAKSFNSTQKLSVKQQLETPCLWKKELKIRFDKTSFIDKNAKGSTLAYIFLGISVVFCIFLCACYCRARGYRMALEKIRREIKAIPSVPEKEYFGNEPKKDDINTTQPDAPKAAPSKPKDSFGTEIQPKVDYGEEDNV